jgi:cytochrome c-type biogenesis protein CcmF
MVAGISFLGLKIGSNPFVLLRNEVPGEIFSRPEYLSMVRDGNDLNPLLQNYWMVIHPPVLFLGFASTLIPFAFAISGLLTKRFGDWAKDALPWALFSGGILSLGIMMGAAWAYESLTLEVTGPGILWKMPHLYRGWCWYREFIACLFTDIRPLTKSNLFFSYSFFPAGFIFYLLNPSGDLSDTSVHAFTGEGITRRHLQTFLLVFVLPSLYLFFRNYKKIPHYS